MHKARAFFFVCAGIFLLALAYHLGARSAHAQSDGTAWFFVGPDGYGSAYIVTAAGDYWMHTPGLGWRPNVAGNLFGGAAGGRTVVSLQSRMLLTSTGEVWYGNAGGPWVNAGVPPFGPTVARQETFGGLKARYR